MFWKKKEPEEHPEKTPLYDYQKIGVFRLIHKFKGRGLLADDVGLGKSIQALYASVPYRRKRPIVIVGPNAVKYGWDVQVKQHTKYRTWILNGTKPPKSWPANVPEVIIINWDILQYWVEMLKKLDPSVIIGDEIHYAKSPSAKRTKAFKRLCQGVKTIYCLSGTPIENNPVEFFTSLNILRPDLFPVFTHFANRYSNPKHTRWGVQYKGSANTKELHKLLERSIMVRRTKDEVLKDLPPLQRNMVPLEIDSKKYQEAERNIIAYLHKYKNKVVHRRGGEVEALTKLNYLLQVTSELKMKSVIEWIDNFLENTNKKLTVFAHHRAFLETLHEKYKNNSVLVYGGMSIDARRGSIRRFVKDKNVRVFLGSITATGTGINDLQLVCSDMVIAELIWVGLKLLQVEGRLHRIGQKHQVNVNYLIALETIEQVLCEAIHSKQRDFNAIVDGKEEIEQQEFDIFNEVIIRLQAKRKRKGK